MKNKKMVIVLIVILIIISIGVLIFSLTQKSVNNNTTNNIINNAVDTTSSNENADESNSLSTQTYTIKSSKDKPIEMEGLEAIKVQLIYTDEQLEVITTLQNNTEEDIQGFYISLRLLDENNNIITYISYNSEETIKSHNTITFNNYITGLDNAEDIKDVAINHLIKNSLKNTFNQNFEDMERYDEYVE